MCAQPAGPSYEAALGRKGVTSEPGWQLIKLDSEGT